MRRSPASLIAKRVLAFCHGAFGFRPQKAIRFGVIWLTAWALIAQTTLTLSSSPALADSTSLSVICSLAGAEGPFDSPNSIAAGHLKCIACVLGQSFAPPPLSATLTIPLVVVAFSYAQRDTARPFSETPHYSHSARGPPATT
jgi:hypothetical protein